MSLDTGGNPACLYIQVGGNINILPRLGETDNCKFEKDVSPPSAILKDPEQYFTPEIMQKLDEAAAKEFRYGN